MSISTRKIGALVPCAICGADVLVPDHDDVGPARTVAPVEDAIFAAPVEPSPEVFAPPSPPLVADSTPPPAPLPAENSTPATAPQEVTQASPAADDEEDEIAPLLMKSRRFNDEELDLTAMVDVVFQLLIFFMVTASFSLQKSIEVPTPDQPRQGVSQALQQLEELQDVAILVAIDDRNVVSIDEEPLADLSQLPDVLSARMRRDQKSELIVTAARNATHRTVISVIDAANEVGMQRIRLGTSQRGGE